MQNDRSGKPSKVQSRLLRVFVLQLALISLITVAGILAASMVAERVLVNQALVGEASYFWSRRADNPVFPLPNTLNLQSWFAASGNKPEIPSALADLAPGQHRVDVEGDQRIVYVSERDGDLLYLLFQDETVSNLGFYFGVVPLAFVLLVMYSLAFMTYWLSKRAVSPIARLADYIERFDLNARDASELDLTHLHGPKDSETLVLAQALEHFVERSKASIERERNFTRYASHELRTPIAVIQGSIANLELIEHTGAAGRAVQRIKRSSNQMAQLINSLLLLARDRHVDDAIERIDVVQLLEQLIDEMRSIDVNENVDISVLPQNRLLIDAPAAVVSIVLGNILRNALKYTERGAITISVKDSEISICDTGSGLTPEQQLRIFEPFFRLESQSGKSASSFIASRSQLSERQMQTPHGSRQPATDVLPLMQVEGLGLGLAIVRHFCDIHGWRVTVSSQVGEGSCFVVTF